MYDDLGLVSTCLSATCDAFDGLGSHLDRAPEEVASLVPAGLPLVIAADGSASKPALRPFRRA